MKFRSKLYTTVGASVLVLGLFVNQANAADIERVAMAGPNWERIYAGGTIGTVLGHAVDTQSGDFNNIEQDITTGLQIGRNWQTDNYVWGVEADLGLGGLSWGGSQGNDENALSLNLMSSLRLRLGMNAGNHLFYVTAGAGVLLGEAFTSSGASSGSESHSEWNFRPVVGLGMESMVTPSMSVKVEGLAFIGKEDFGKGGSTSELLDTVGVFRTGVNFFFGAPGGAEIEQFVDRADWNRMYFGGHLGANIAQAYDNSSGEFHHNDTGISAGLQVGANFDQGMFIWGVEADISNGGLEWGESHRLDIPVVGTVRARLGVPIDNHLIYATAGAGMIWGFGQDSSTSQNDDDVAVRPVVGVGIESMITERISLKAEGLAWIGEDKFSWHPTCGCSSQGVMDTMGTIRLGVNFHL